MNDNITVEIPTKYHSPKKYKYSSMSYSGLSAKDKVQSLGSGMFLVVYRDNYGILLLVRGLSHTNIQIFVVYFVV